MRILGYTAARILVLGVSLLVLYLLGARGILLIALAFVISAILSYILLYGQRERLAGALNRRIEKATSKAANKAAEFKERLEEGTSAEDVDEPDAQAQPADQDKLAEQDQPAPRG